MHGLAAHGLVLKLAKTDSEMVERVVPLQDSLNQGEEKAVGAEAVGFAYDEAGFSCDNVKLFDTWERACCK